MDTRDGKWVDLRRFQREGSWRPCLHIRWLDCLPLCYTFDLHLLANLGHVSSILPWQWRLLTRLLVACIFLQFVLISYFKSLLHCITQFTIFFTPFCCFCCFTFKCFFIAHLFHCYFKSLFIIIYFLVFTISSLLDLVFHIRLSSIKTHYTHKYTGTHTQC